MSAAEKIFDTARPNDFGDSGIALESASADTSAPYLLMSGYDAANRSTSRGYLYWPTDNPRFELSPPAAREIRRKVAWLYANFGFARRLVHGMAKMLGALTPYPATKNEKWNEAAFEHFQARAGSPLLFDRGGRFDFWSAQPQVNRRRFKDGFSFALKTATNSGGGQLCFYEAAQLCNPDKADSASWSAGVNFDKHSRHLAYGLRDADGKGGASVFAARDALFYGNWESHAALSPASVLAHAVSNMTDIVETRGFIKKGIKDHSRLGVVMEQEPGVKIMGGSAAGLAGHLIQTEVVTDAGNTQTINWEQVMSGAATPRLKPGQRVKVVADDRPSPNTLEFEKAILRDCTWGCDLPYEALCDIAGLTGPGVRYVMAEIERWILQELQKQAHWCREFWAFWCAREIKAGRLKSTREPYWRKVEWIGQPSMTIDRGQIGKLAIVQLDSGLTTWADEWGSRGKHWKRNIKQRCLEVAFAKRAAMEAAEEYDVKLSIGEVFPNLGGGAAQASESLDEDERKAREEKRGQEEDDKAAA